MSSVLSVNDRDMSSSNGDCSSNNSRRSDRIFPRADSSKDAVSRALRIFPTVDANLALSDRPLVRFAEEYHRFNGL